MTEILTEDDLTLESAIAQIVGYASTCWEHLDRAGVFQDQNARMAVDELLG